MAPKAQGKRRAVDNTEVKSVDSDISNESNEEMAEEESERSSQSRKRNKGKGKRDPLVEKIAEMIIARDAAEEKLAGILAQQSEIMRAQKVTDAKLAEMMSKSSQSNKPVEMLTRDMLDVKKLSASNDEVTKELNRIMDSCRFVSTCASSVKLINVTKTGDEDTVASKLRVLAPKVVEDTLRENGKFGQPLTNEEFLQMFSFQDLYDSVLKGGLLNWDPSVFIKIMPKEPRFEDTLDVVEKFSSFYSNWMAKARATMRQIPHPMISDMIVTKMISVFPEDIRSMFNVKREVLKRSEDIKERLKADNPEMIIAWVHETQRQVQAPSSDSDTRYKSSLYMIRAFREEIKMLKGQKVKPGYSKTYAMTGAEGNPPQKSAKELRVERLLTSASKITKAEDKARFEEIVKKYNGFYSVCINCGSKTQKGARCRCGKNGASSEKPEVVTLYKTFKEFKELQKKYNLIPATNSAK